MYSTVSVIGWEKLRPPQPGGGGVERRPAAAGVELRVGLEELGVAGLAGVDALGLGVGVLTDEGSLGAGLTEHGVLLRRELLAPLLVGLLHVVGHVSSVPTRTSVHETEPTLDTPSVTQCYILGIDERSEPRCRSGSSSPADPAAEPAAEPAA